MIYLKFLGAHDQTMHVLTNVPTFGVRHMPGCVILTIGEECTPLWTEDQVVVVTCID
jgi:hypothetical protein